MAQYNFSKDYKGKTRIKILSGYLTIDSSSQSRQDLDETCFCNYYFLLQFKRVASKVCLVARTLGCGGMEQNAYDDATEQQRKPAEYWALDFLKNQMIIVMINDNKYNKVAMLAVNYYIAL